MIKYYSSDNKCFETKEEALAHDDLRLSKKRKLSNETRKRISASRRNRTTQPRSGQSTKDQNLYEQMNSDYLVSKRFKGDLTTVKTIHEEDTEENNEDQFDEINVGFEDDKQEGEVKIVYRKLTLKEKAKIKQWLESNKRKLTNITAKDGILNQYDIQKVNFSQIKMTESLITHIEESWNESFDPELVDVNEIDIIAQTNFFYKVKLFKKINLDEKVIMILSLLYYFNIFLESYSFTDLTLEAHNKSFESFLKKNYQKILAFEFNSKEELFCNFLNWLYKDKLFDIMLEADTDKLDKSKRKSFLKTFDFKGVKR